MQIFVYLFGLDISGLIISFRPISNDQIYEVLFVYSQEVEDAIMGAMGSSDIIEVATYFKEGTISLKLRITEGYRLEFITPSE